MDKKKPYIPERDEPDEGVTNTREEFIFFIKLFGLVIIGAIGITLIFQFA